MERIPALRQLSDSALRVTLATASDGRLAALALYRLGAAARAAEFAAQTASFTPTVTASASVQQASASASASAADPERTGEGVVGDGDGGQQYAGRSGATPPAGEGFAGPHGKGSGGVGGVGAVAGEGSGGVGMGGRNEGSAVSSPGYTGAVQQGGKAVTLHQARSPLVEKAVAQKGEVPGGVAVTPMASGGNGGEGGKQEKEALPSETTGRQVSDESERSQIQGEDDGGAAAAAAAASAAFDVDDVKRDQRFEQLVEIVDCVASGLSVSDISKVCVVVLAIGWVAFTLRRTKRSGVRHTLVRVLMAAVQKNVWTLTFVSASVFNELLPR